MSFPCAPLFGFPPDPPTMRLAPIWWTRGRGLGGLRTFKYYKYSSGLWGPPAWTSYFLASVWQNASGLPRGLAPPPEPTNIFVAVFGMASDRSIWGSCGFLSSPLLFRNVARPTTRIVRTAQTSPVFLLKSGLGLRTCLVQTGAKLSPDSENAPR